MEDVFAVYIWSDDWWVFSSDTWIPTEQVYSNSEVISPEAVNWQKVIDGEAYHASVYYEIGKTDAHGFQPTHISADENSAIIEGVQLDFEGNEIGEPEPREFIVGDINWYQAPRIDVDFEVTKIIPALTEDDKESIITYIEEIQEADMATAEDTVGIAAAETFAAKSKKSKKRRSVGRSSRRRGSKSIMQRKNFAKKKTRAKGYSPHGYAENFGAETFKSEGESQSDAIAAESSKAVEGLNPTPVSDGQWLAETINKKAEARHSYPHRVIEGDTYRHYDGSGRRRNATDRGASIRADRRRYRPNADLKPGQGHMGDFVREAQGYDDKLDDSMGERNRGRHRGRMTMADRRDMSEGMARHMGRRKYSNVRTMDRGDRMMAEDHQGYNARLDDSMGERNRGRHHGRMTMHDRRDMSKGIEEEMGRRPYSAVRTMDRTRRRLRAESKFDRLQKTVADEEQEDHPRMSDERAMKIGGAVAYDSGVKKYDRLSGGHGKEIMEDAAREHLPASTILRRDDYDAEMTPSMKRFMSQRTHRADTPTASPEDYSPTGASPTAENPKADGPSSVGTGDQIISVQSPSAPPDDVKFAETKESEFGVVGSGSNFGQDLNAEWCTKHAETFNACGCDRRRAEGKSEPTNATPSGDDPLVADATNQPGSEMVDVDSPSAPPPNIFDSSAETFLAGCGCGRNGCGGCGGCGCDCRCSETFNADMNYDGSLYGEQYFPDALTANQVKVGELGSTESGDGSGQGVLEWDGSRVGPSPPDEKAAEIINRRGLGVVLATAAIVTGLGLMWKSNKAPDA